jgi:hypothetical protein
MRDKCVLMKAVSLAHYCAVQSLQRACSINGAEKMAEFVERLKVMQKEDYERRKTELRYDAEYRAKNGTDADDLQIRVQRAVLRADVRAEPYAESRAEHGAETVSAPAGQPVYRGELRTLLFSSIGATCTEKEQVAPMELQGVWATHNYRQDAPMELQDRADKPCRKMAQKWCRKVAHRADTCAELRAGVCAEHHAEPCAVARAVVLADDYAEKWHRCRNICRNELQKWFAETVQNLLLIGCAEKMAEMQKHLQKLEGQTIKVV